MKRFFKTILVFLIPIFMVTAIFEIYLRKKNTVYEEKLEGLISGYNNIELLILGNSHSLNNVDPNQFQVNAYNMAASNQSIYFDKRITLKHIDSLKNLRYVMISIDYHSLYFSSQGIRDTWSYYDYGIKYKNKKEQLSDISYFWFGYTPKITLSIIKDGILKKIHGELTDADQVIKGWMPLNGQDKSSFSDNGLESRANYFLREVRKSAESKEILIDLEDFIIELKKRDIQPILFTMPMYKGIYDLLDENHLIRNRENVNYLSKKFEIRYLDFTRDSVYNKLFFFNSDHLNKKGAILFSNNLNKSIFNN